jgi:hypothetical protein
MQTGGGVTFRVTSHGECGGPGDGFALDPGPKKAKGGAQKCLRQASPGVERSVKGAVSTAGMSGTAVCI